MPLSTARLRTILAWIVIALIAAPVGGAVLLAVLSGDSPCILCWAQRTSMILIALVGLFILRYGPRPRYLAMAVLLATWGAFMGLRHATLHLARDIGQGFSAPIFGIHTYSWSWIIHTAVLVVIAGLMFLLREDAVATWPRQADRASRLAGVLFAIVVSANAVQAFVSTGPPPFFGQADPVRFSLNPRHWVWGSDELRGPMSLRGPWAVREPDPTGGVVDPDPAHGPIGPLPSLSVSGRERVEVALSGALTDLARDSVTGTFLAVTDQYDVYLLDSALTRVLHHVRLDKGFSVDLSLLAGAAFVGDTLVVLSTNKSYALLRPDSQADPKREWRHFLVTDGGVTELGLGRFQTVRAGQMYVMSLAVDPATDELITVAVPSPRHQHLVVSRFARDDWVLASEFEPRLAPGLTVTGQDRSPAEYVVTGAVVADGLLYAISAAYSTLLVIDPEEKTIRQAYAVPGLEHPTGLAVRGHQLLVAQRDGGIAVLERPVP